MKISQQLIDKAITTQDRGILPVFCIVKDIQRNLVDGRRRTVYSVVTRPDYRNATEVTRKDAMALIQLCGMIPCHEDTDGAVYDTKNRKYQETYRGYNVLF